MTALKDLVQGDPLSSYAFGDKSAMGPALDMGSGDMFGIQSMQGQYENWSGVVSAQTSLKVDAADAVVLKLDINSPVPVWWEVYANAMFHRNVADWNYAYLGIALNIAPQVGAQTQWAIRSAHGSIGSYSRSCRAKFGLAANTQYQAVAMISPTGNWLYFKGGHYTRMIGHAWART